MTFKVNGLVTCPENKRYNLSATNANDQTIILYSNEKKPYIDAIFLGETFEVNGKNADAFLNLWFPNGIESFKSSSPDLIPQEQVNQAANSIMTTAQMIKANASKGK